MMASRGMGAVAPSKMPKGKKTARRDDTDFTQYAAGGKVNAAGNYTKPSLRKRIVSQVKAAATIPRAKTIQMSYEGHHHYPQHHLQEHIDDAADDDADDSCNSTSSATGYW